MRTRIKQMHRYLLLGLFAGIILSGGTLSAFAQEREYVPPETVSVERSRPSWGHRILWYVPNRLLDVVDMFRLRARVGKGWAATARLTEPMSFYAGSYRSTYVGLPGPRYPHKFKKPYGKEDYVGLQLSLANATDENPNEPDYSYTEFVLGLHVWTVGADLGTDPVELLDFIAGVFLFDLRGDDL